MIPKFIRSVSTVAPKLLDMESSQTHVLMRRDVVEKTRENRWSGESETYFEYEEAQLTKLEYQQYVSEQLEAENAKLKTIVSEQADALVELAGLLEGQNVQINENTDALIELATLIS